LKPHLPLADINKKQDLVTEIDNILKYVMPIASMINSQLATTLKEEKAARRVREISCWFDSNPKRSMEYLAADSG
jgi:hypothetical protein